MRYPVIALLVFVLFGFKSDFSSDLSRINYAYFNLNRNISINSIIQYPGEQTQIQNIKVAMKSIDHYFMTSGNTEFLVTPKYKVAIQKELKVIMLDKNNPTTTDDLPIYLFDTLTKFYSDIQHKILSESEAEYTLLPKNSYSKEVKIKYNLKTFVVNQVAVKMYDPRVKKEFSVKSSYQYSPIGQSDLPGLNKYLIENTTGEFSLAPAYKSYQLINHLQN